MSSEYYTLSLQKIPSTLRVEVGTDPEAYFSLNIVEAQLALERLAEQHPKPEDLCEAIRQWIARTTGHVLSISQAWDLIPAIRMGFDAHKKKLLDSLTSDSGFTSTLFDSFEKKDQQPSTSSTESSPDCSPSAPSTTPESTPSVPPKKSMTSSSPPPEIKT